MVGAHPPTVKVRVDDQGWELAGEATADVAQAPSAPTSGIPASGRVPGSGVYVRVRTSDAPQGEAGEDEAPPSSLAGEVAGLVASAPTEPAPPPDAALELRLPGPPSVPRDLAPTPDDA